MDAVVAVFVVLSRMFPKGPYENPQPGYMVFRLGLEPGGSLVQVRTVSASSDLFGRVHRYIS
jgi:hypothetical protein